MKFQLLVSAGTACAAIVAACGGSMEPVSSTTTTSAPVVVRPVTLARPIALHDAADRVTAARCGRELDCRNIGYERTWRSYDACARDVGPLMRSVLSEGRCPHGVDPLALEDCLDAARTETCAPPLSSRGRISARCDASALCL